MTGALAAALVLGVTSTSTPTAAAQGAAAAPVAQDVTHDGPVYRTVKYVNDGDYTIDLNATGGTGALTYQVVDQPTVDGKPAGTVTVAGSVATLKPNAGVDPGPVSFTYQAVDADGVESNVATVSFVYENQTPLTRELAFSTEKDTPLDIWPYARDAEDGGPFAWQKPGNRITYGEPKHGTIEPFFTEEDDEPGFKDIAHKVVYVPDTGYVGPDSFTYTMTDEDSGSSTSTIAVDVTKPAKTARGELNNVRYRCPFYVKINEDGQSDPNGEYDENTTRIVSRVMGGDVAFRVDVRAHAPKSVSPGEKYTVPDTEIDLKMPQGMAEMLAGQDLLGENLDLATTGFGQTAVGGQSTSDAHFKDTATGKEYDIPMSGLKSEMMPMTLPVPPEGVKIPVTGKLPELTAPESGSTVVSMPHEFFIDSILEPGVLGVIKSVGLRCYALPGTDLKLLSVPVVANTRTSATSPKVAYGQQAKVHVKVSKKANGKARVYQGKKLLGSAKVKQGRATVKLGRKSLRPGTHRLRVKFSGSRHFKASQDRTGLRVTKASSKVHAAKLGPAKVIAKKTRARVRVLVRAAQLKPSGRVVVRAGGKVVGKAKVKKGTVTLRLQRFAKPGRKRLKVSYLGSSIVKAGTDRLAIRVVPRR